MIVETADVKLNSVKCGMTIEEMLIFAPSCPCHKISETNDEAKDINYGYSLLSVLPSPMLGRHEWYRT